jgi:hypothetical protein
LYELIDHVGQVRIDRDEKRELLTLLLTDKHGTELPAKALSDGILRFLALASRQGEHGRYCERQSACLPAPHSREGRSNAQGS